MTGSARSDGLTLWGVGTPRTLRAHWALAELGLEYGTRPIEPRSSDAKSADFTRLNARQKVPVLQDADFVITESAAILVYLSDTYSAAGAELVPRCGRERAACLELSFLVVSEFDAASLYVIRRHGSLAHIYGEAPAAVAAARSYFCSQMRSIDRLLVSNPPFILGERFTAADILLCTCLNWALREGIDLSEEARGYAAAMMSRPAFQHASICNARGPES